MGLRLAQALAAASALVGFLPAYAAADVVIAVPAPLAGRHQAMGEAVQRGAERAVRALNDAGGLLGERISLVAEDDACDSAKAATAARVIAERKPAAVIGHPCSGAAVAAAPAYAAAGLLFIAPGVRHPALTDKRAGPTIFRLGGRDDRQGEAAAAWLARMAPYGRIALLQDRTLYSRAIAEDAARALKAAGLQSVLMLPIVSGRKDYEPVARQLEEAGTEALLFAGYPTEALVILDDLRRAGSDARFIGSDSLATAEFSDASAADATRIRVLVPRAPEVNANWLAAEPEDSGGKADMKALAALTHAAVEAWAHGVREAKSFEGAGVAAALARDAANTEALGAVGFDEKGDARIISFAPAVWNGASWEPRD